MNHPCIFLVKYNILEFNKRNKATKQVSRGKLRAKMIKRKKKVSISFKSICSYLYLEIRSTNKTLDPGKVY